MLRQWLPSSADSAKVSFPRARDSSLYASATVPSAEMCRPWRVVIEGLASGFLVPGFQVYGSEFRANGVACRVYGLEFAA